MAIGLQVARSVSALFLFLGTFLCGMAPAVVKWYLSSWPNAMKRRVAEEKWIIKQSKLVMSFFMCFGGGILFATCFIHMLPELLHTFEEYWKKQNEARNSNATTHSDDEKHRHFPLPEFIMCGGFLFVYALEEVIYYIISKFQEVGPLETPIIARQHRSTETTEAKVKEESDELIESDSKTGYGTVSEASEENHSNSKPIDPQVSTLYYPSTMTSQESKLIVFKSGLSLRGILAVTALSFHSLFEGLSVGMQRTENEIWTVLFAVAIHKFVIAVVIGIETVQAGTPIKVVIPYMMVFSFMSPLGMLIAMATYSRVPDDLVSGSLIAISTGTLIYVTFFEILLKERSSELTGNFQLLGVFAGFILMTLIDSFSSDSGHSH